MKKTLYLEEGDLIAAASNAPGDGLVELLVREGRLTSADAQRLAETVARGGGGDAALLSLLPLSAGDRASAIARRAESVVCSVFGWSHGEFRFVDRAPRSSERVALPPSPWLVLEGVRRRYGLDRLLVRLPVDATLVRTAVLDESVRALALGGDERRLGDAVGASATVGEVLASHPGQALGEQTTLQVLWALCAVGGLQLEDAPAPALRSLPATESLRAAVAARRELCDEGDYFELLGARRSDSPHELRRAYERAIDTFSPGRVGEAALAADLQAIRGALDEAWEVLSDDGLRADYRAALAHPERLP
jgi:hypothetical protein